MNATLSGLAMIPAGSSVMPGPNRSGNVLRIGEIAVGDPRSGGLQRPVGSLAYNQAGTVCYQKTGTGATDWTAFGIPPLPSTMVLADATTNTAPDATIEQHTTSGTAAAGFGLTDAVELETGGGTTRRVETDATTLTVATNAAEEAKREIALMQGGALMKVGGWGFSSNQPWPFVYAGDPANLVGLRAIPSQARLDIMLAGSPLVVFNSAPGTQMQSRFQFNRAGNTASATTVTLPNGANVFPITGATTINGLVTTNWQAGAEIRLELPSGITITHNSGAPGASAVAIQLKAGANLVTARVTFLPLCYNGTFWYEVG